MARPPLATATSLPEDPVVMVYVTWPDLQTARDFSRFLITQHLAACVNLLPQMESHYNWNDQVQTSSEVVMLIKTVLGQVAEISEKLSVHHPYDLPCRLVFTPDTTHSCPDFLNWVRKEIHLP